MTLNTCLCTTWQAKQHFTLKGIVHSLYQAVCHLKRYFSAMRITDWLARIWNIKKKAILPIINTRRNKMRFRKYGPRGEKKLFFVLEVLYLYHYHHYRWGVRCNITDPTFTVTSAICWSTLPFLHQQISVNMIPISKQIIHASSVAQRIIRTIIFVSLWIPVMKKKYVQI